MKYGGSLRKDCQTQGDFLAHFLQQPFLDAFLVPFLAAFFVPFLADFLAAFLAAFFVAFFGIITLLEIRGLKNKA
jgi:hypothetical protein